MMKITTTTGKTGDEVVRLIQEKQITEFNNYLSRFLNYDVVFKFGNEPTKCI